MSNKFFTYPSGDFVRATFGSGFMVQWKKDDPMTVVAKRLRDLCNAYLEESKKL